MRVYAIVNKETGRIKHIVQWGDDRDFPENYPMEDNEIVITIEDAEKTPIKHDCFRYDFASKSFIEFTPIVEPVAEQYKPIEQRISDLELLVLQLGGVI